MYVLVCFMFYVSLSHCVSFSIFSIMDWLCFLEVMSYLQIMHTTWIGAPPMIAAPVNEWATLLTVLK